MVDGRIGALDIRTAQRLRQKQAAREADIARAVAQARESEEERVLSEQQRVAEVQRLARQAAELEARLVVVSFSDAPKTIRNRLAHNRKIIAQVEDLERRRQLLSAQKQQEAQAGRQEERFRQELASSKAQRALAEGDIKKAERFLKELPISAAEREEIIAGTREAFAARGVTITPEGVRVKRVEVLERVELPERRDRIGVAPPREERVYAPERVGTEETRLEVPEAQRLVTGERVLEPVGIPRPRVREPMAKLPPPLPSRLPPPGRVVIQEFGEKPLTAQERKKAEIERLAMQLELFEPTVIELGELVVPRIKPVPKEISLDVPFAFPTEAVSRVKLREQERLIKRIRATQVAGGEFEAGVITGGLAAGFVAGASLFSGGTLTLPALAIAGGAGFIGGAAGEFAEDITFIETGSPELAAGAGLATTVGVGFGVSKGLSRLLKPTAVETVGIADVEQVRFRKGVASDIELTGASRITTPVGAREVAFRADLQALAKPTKFKTKEVFEKFLGQKVKPFVVKPARLPAPQKELLRPLTERAVGRLEITVPRIQIGRLKIGRVTKVVPIGETIVAAPHEAVVFDIRMPKVPALLVGQQKGLVAGIKSTKPALFLDELRKRASLSVSGFEKTFKFRVLEKGERAVGVTFERLAGRLAVGKDFLKEKITVAARVEQVSAEALGLRDLPFQRGVRLGRAKGLTEFAKSFKEGIAPARVVPAPKPLAIVKPHISATVAKRASEQAIKAAQQSAKSLTRGVVISSAVVRGFQLPKERPVSLQLPRPVEIGAPKEVERQLQIRVPKQVSLQVPVSAQKQFAKQLQKAVPVQVTPPIQVAPPVQVAPPIQLAPPVAITAPIQVTPPVQITPPVLVTPPVFVAPTALQLPLPAPLPLPTPTPVPFPLMAKLEEPVVPLERPPEKVQGYHAQVRSKMREKAKGRFFRASKALPKNEALDVGSELVDNSVARSFRLRKAKQSVPRSLAPVPLRLGKFRRAKKERGVFVEKSRHAIDSIGELQGITAKGLLKLRKMRAAGIPISKKKRRKQRRQSIQSVAGQFF